MRGALRLAAAAAALPAALFAALLLAGRAHAHTGGISGASGKQGSTCAECHSGGTHPDVAFALPDAIHAGETVAMRFTVQSRSPVGKAAGFDVAVEGGTLVPLPGQGAHLSNGELTHNEPLDNDAGRNAGWDFQWIAPAAAGRYRIWGAGNSVNLNGQSTGDQSKAIVLRIDVLAAVATDTPTATPTATTPPVAPALTATTTAAAMATVPTTAVATDSPSPTAPGPATETATPEPSATATAPCAGDCNGDGVVTINELITAVGIALGAQPLTDCASVDQNGDAQVGINELVTSVTRALGDC